MITTLSDLYRSESLRLPGVSTPVLDAEFRRAERRACVDASIWRRDFTVSLVADTYTYAFNPPANTDPLLVLDVLDGSGNRVDVNLYSVAFAQAASVDGYEVTDATADTESGIEGTYADTGETLNGDEVYSNGAFSLFKAVEGVDNLSSLYILATDADYEAFAADGSDFPVSYYAALPPVSGFSGVLAGFGSYSGTVRSNYLSSQASGSITFERSLVDGRAPETLTLTVSLAPRFGFSAAPAEVLTRHGELISQLAVAELLAYPRTYPWSDPARSQLAARRAAHLLALAKFDRYRPMARSSVVMRAPHGFL